jgi:hypothetical protein
VVHDLFYEMCGVDARRNKGSRTTELCAIQPLSDGRAHERGEHGDVWHPIWSGSTKDKVNEEFINEAARLIWVNEEVSRHIWKTNVTYLA